MQLPFAILASGDSWIGLLIFIIIAVVSSFNKMAQKGQPEMPEELPPRPLPPQPHPSQPQQTRRALTEEQVQEVLRRMRKPAPSQVPPPVVETNQAPPRRFIKPDREEPRLPSTRPEIRFREAEPPSEHPAPTPREPMPSAAQPKKPAATADLLPPIKALYREQLRSGKEIRRAIVMRELLGPPLALRQDW